MNRASLPFGMSVLTSLAILWAGTSATGAATYMWTNQSASSSLSSPLSWNLASNWVLTNDWGVHQVPGPTDIAKITLTLASRMQIKLDADVQIAGLIMGGSGHAVLLNGHTLTVTGPMNLGNVINQQEFLKQEIILDSGKLVGSSSTLVTGGIISWSNGTIAGPLTLDSATSLRLQGTTGSPYDLQGTVTNSGIVKIVSGNLRFRDAQFYDLAGGLVDFQSDSDIVNYGVGTELFSNAGTIRKSGGTGVSTVDIALFNQGTIDAQTGTLDWSNGGVVDTGSTFTGTGTNQFSGGTFTATAMLNIPNARLSGATLVGDNGGLGGSWVWTSGSIGGPNSTFTLASSGLMTLKGTVGSPYDLMGAFTNLGTIQILTGNLRFRGGELYNKAGGLIDFQSDSDIADYGMGTELVSNQGTIRKSNGTAISTVDVTFQNQGQIDVQKGTLEWANGGSFEPGSTFSGTGTNLFSGSEFALTTALDIPNARLAGATLIGDNGKLDGSWVWTSGSIGGPNSTFTLASSGLMTLKGTVGSPYDLMGTLTNLGTIQVLSGNLRFRGGELYNQPGGLIDFQSDSDATDYGIGTEFLSNQGTIRKSGGTVVTTVAVEVLNRGLIDVQAGTLDWANGGGFDLGSVFVGAGTNQFSDGIFTLTTSLNIPSARLAGATLVGDNAALGGAWLWTSGSFGRPESKLTLSGTGVLALKGTTGSPYDLQGVFTNLGTIQLLSGNLRLRDGQLHNAGTALVDFQTDSRIDSYGVGTESLSNQGTIRKSGGIGVSTLDVPFQNAGAIQTTSGTLALNDGGTLAPGSNFSGSGTNRFSGGTFAITTSVVVPHAHLAGATLAVSGKTLSGSWIWTSGTLGQPGGSMALGSDAVVTLNGTAGSPYDLEGAVTNLGTINLVRGNIRCRDGQLYNETSGVVDFQGDSVLDNYSTGTELAHNKGSLRKTAGTGTSVVDVPFTNRGVVDAQTGTISLNASHDLTGGRLNCGLNGPGSNGRIHLSGNATLQGICSANLNNGYHPNAGDTFSVVTYGSRIGAFSGVTLPSTCTWETSYSATTFTLKVTGSSSGSAIRLTINLASGLPRLIWNSNVGDRFQLQYQDPNPAGQWVDLGPILVATGTTTDITDPTAIGVPTRLYRVAQQLP